MRVLAIVHQRDAGPGVFADVIRKRADLDVWMPAEEPGPRPPQTAYDAVMVFGGAMHADQDDRHPWLRLEKTMLAELLSRSVPVLGVCLGAQLLAEAAGAPPRRAGRPEIGWYEVEVSEAGAKDPVLGPLAPLAHSDACLQAYRIGACAWGIQFHAEVTRADAESWIDDYRSDEDAVRLSIDPRALREQTGRCIDRWNALGRGLCDRFLGAAANRGSLMPGRV
jgi:GMP synthase-like glutamine amidotransferase